MNERENEALAGTDYGRRLTRLDEIRLIRPPAGADCLTLYDEVDRLQREALLSMFIGAGAAPDDPSSGS